jgi:hypothetical protein
VAQMRKMQTGQRRHRTRRHPRVLGGIGSLLLALMTTACGITKPLYLESKYAIPAAPTGAVQVVVATPVDLRPFSSASNRAPVASVQGDPADSALTARVVGRRLDGLDMLGPNILLPPGESVAQWVGRAVVDGLRDAGVEAVLDSAGPVDATDGAHPTPARLRVSIHEFWLDVKPAAGLATIEYRVEIALQGSVPGFGEGAGASAQGGVSAGGLDMTLWRRSFDRALQEIATKTARLADPLAARAPR